MISNTALIILLIIQIPLWFYLSQGLLHYLAAHLFKKKTRGISSSLSFHDFSLIITAHQNTDFIPPILDSIRKQNYSNYHAYVVADDCDISAVSHLSGEKVSILKPGEALNSKIKSIDYAISHFNRQHDYMIIFDPDNLLESDYLKNLNEFINTSSFKVVQTKLSPKNTNNSIARLDTIGSSYYDYIFRESKNIVGLSAHIYGLGIAIPVETYRTVSYNYMLGGFDKRIQLDLVRSGNKIGYCRNAVVYDEKTSDEKTLRNQRTRWLYSYFKYMQDGIKTLLEGLSRFNRDILYFGIETLRPPMVILLLSCLIAGILDIFLAPVLILPWIFFFVLFLLSAVLILFKVEDNRKIMHALIYMPRFLFIQLMAFIGIRKAKKMFLKTEHEHIIYIDDLLKK